MWEAKGEVDLAMGEYEEILNEDPSNLLAVKRQVAVLRSHGGPQRLAEAAKRLCEVAASFMNCVQTSSAFEELPFRIRLEAL